MELALNRLNFLESTDLDVVRALLLYLEVQVVIRGMRAVWSLNGLLIRVAQSMGLHRDASNFPDMPPFEQEMRRRVWWHICFLDERVTGCRVSEAALSPSNFDSHPPANIDDRDVGQVKSIDDSKGYTDLTFCIIRCQLWHLRYRVQRASQRMDESIKQRTLQDIDATRRDMEETWLKLVPSTGDLGRFIRLFTRLHLDNCVIVILSQNPAQETDKKDKVRQDCLALAASGLEAAQTLQQDSSMRKWRWTIQQHILWPCLSAALLQLKSRTWDVASERVWDQASEVFLSMRETRTGDVVGDDVLQRLMDEVQRRRAEEQANILCFAGLPIECMDGVN